MKKTLIIESEIMPRQKLYPDEETIAMSIRVPASMKKEIEERAAANRRSQNQEVVWLIQLALDFDSTANNQQTGQSREG